MARITLLIGAVLIAIGMIGYFGTESKSVTALIPSFFGFALCLFGAVALRDNWRAFGMHAAIGVSTLGMLGGLFRGIPQLIGYFSGDEEVNPRAMTFVLMMTVACIAHVGLCVQSFIQARKNAAKKPPTPSDGQ